MHADLRERELQHLDMMVTRSGGALDACVWQQPGGGPRSGLVRGQEGCGRRRLGGCARRWPRRRAVDERPGEEHGRREIEAVR